MVDFVISLNVLPKRDLVDPETRILGFLLAWMNYLRLTEASPIFFPHLFLYGCGIVEQLVFAVSRDFWWL